MRIPSPVLSAGDTTMTAKDPAPGLWGWHLRTTERNQTHQVRGWKERSEDHDSKRVDVPVVTNKTSLKTPAKLPTLLSAKRLRVSPLHAPSAPLAPPCLSSLLQPSTHYSSSGYISSVEHPFCSCVPYSHPSSRSLFFLLFFFFSLSLVSLFPFLSFSSFLWTSQQAHTRCLLAEQQEQQSRGVHADGESSFGGDAIDRNGSTRVIKAKRVGWVMASTVQTNSGVSPLRGLCEMPRLWGSQHLVDSAQVVWSLEGLENVKDRGHRGKQNKWGESSLLPIPAIQNSTFDSWVSGEAV